jgi:hypothetical protein
MSALTTTENLVKTRLEYNMIENQLAKNNKEGLNT